MLPPRLVMRRHDDPEAAQIIELFGLRGIGPLTRGARATSGWNLALRVVSLPS
jgi:hypothetical protein